jgi:dUTP pyrophosphatase
MNANIHLQGSYITFEQDEIQTADGAFALLADVPEAVKIPSGRFAKIPVPISVQGDGRTLALLHVMAGRSDTDDGHSGQFVTLSTDKHERIVAIVRNDTPNAMIINPKNSIGTLEFVIIGDDDAEEDEPEHDGDAAVGLSIPTVYAPEFIDGATKPEYATAGAAAFDLRADLAENVTLEPGARKVVPTGLRMAIPEGYEGQMRPRSGLAAKHGITITNAPGTIDSDYRGEIMAILQNTGDEPFVIKPKERIAQLLIAPVTRAALDFRADLDDTVRGTGGFGSTGRS